MYEDRGVIIFLNTRSIEFAQQPVAVPQVEVLDFLLAFKQKHRYLLFHKSTCLPSIKRNGRQGCGELVLLLRRDQHLDQFR